MWGAGGIQAMNWPIHQISWKLGKVGFEQIMGYSIICLSILVLLIQVINAIQYLKIIFTHMENYEHVYAYLCNQAWYCQY